MKILKNKDIKILRNRWLKEQDNLDPISRKLIKFPTLDHSHKNTYCRGVLDSTSNQWLGKVENSAKRFMYETLESTSLRELLSNLIEYLDHNKESLKIVHPREISLTIRRFSRQSLKTQSRALEALGVTSSKNSKLKVSKKENLKLYRKALMKPENIYKV